MGRLEMMDRGRAAAILMACGGGTWGHPEVLNAIVRAADEAVAGARVALTEEEALALCHKIYSAEGHGSEKDVSPSPWVIDTVIAASGVRDDNGAAIVAKLAEVIKNEFGTPKNTSLEWLVNALRSIMERLRYVRQLIDTRDAEILKLRAELKQARHACQYAPNGNLTAMLAGISGQLAALIGKQHNGFSVLPDGTQMALGKGQVHKAEEARKTQPTGLSFAMLRKANVARLPLFKNKQGEAAHAKADGSDWTPAQWLGALVGELGEYANLRKKYERGDLSYTLYAVAAAKELADAQMYLDILALRCLDTKFGTTNARGVDLGTATIAKFNEVSQRVGADIFIAANGSSTFTKGAK